MTLSGRIQSVWKQVRALPIWLQLAGVGGIAAGFLAFIFFLGFVSGERAIGPAYPFFSKVTNKIENKFFGRKLPPQLESTVYNSALLRLEAKVAHVDTGRDPADTNMLSRNGGGLTSLGDDVLLLAYNGKIYAASGPDDVHETAVMGPDNNQAAYQTLPDNPDYAGYSFHRGYLRYNDLKYIEAPSGPMLVASYTEYNPEGGCYANALARLPLPAGTTDIEQVSASPQDWEVIFRTTPCMKFKEKHLAMEGHMAGGRMVFQAPSTIFLTSGDFHLDGMRSIGPGIAQDPDAMYGKTLQVDVETGEGRIYSMGHRNMQGIAALKDGTILVAEHGPRGGDELNILEEGLNYGWPLESYGTTYGGTPLPGALSFGRHDSFAKPVFAWMPSVAISGMTLIDGFDESWDGDLLVSALSDRSIFRLRMEGQRPIYSERIEIGSRVRYVHQHTDGRIVLWTDNSEMIFLSPLLRVDEGQRFQEWLANADLPRSVKSNLDTAMGRCVECHSFQIGDDEKAPGIAKIFNDPIAETGFAGYSDGLKSKNGKWDRENLTAFLDNPSAFADSYMPPSGIEDPRVTQGLIDYLEHLDNQF